MDYKYIEQLLDRYFQCETSLEEESILRTFFAQNDVPQHLQCYQQLFQCQQEMAGEKLSDDFDERILSLIDKQTDEKVVKARTVRMGYRFRPFFKAAAMVAIVLCLGMAVQQGLYPNQQTSKVPAPAPTQVTTADGETALEKNDKVSVPDSLAKLENTTDRSETLHQ